MKRDPQKPTKPNPIPPSTQVTEQERLRELLDKCGGENSALVMRVRQLAKLAEDLMSMGEPPYSFAVYVGKSAWEDYSRKKQIKKIFGIDANFLKCYLIVSSVEEMIGTVSKEIENTLSRGQLVMVNGNLAVVAAVPEAELVHCKSVIAGTVDSILDGDPMISAGFGMVRGTVLSPKLRKELEQRPLEKGDSVLIFGSCILKLLERAADKKSKKVNIRSTRIEDIKGLDKEIEDIFDVLGLNFDEESKIAINADIERGLALHGPPGCGKTSLARAIAIKLGWYFVLVNGADFEDMFVGNSQKKLREKFDEALRNAPSIIFFDECEAAFPVRGASPGLEHKNDNLAALNTFMDGVEETRGVAVIFASNRIEKVDPAALRAGRVDESILIPRPNREAAAQTLDLYLSRHTISEQGDKEEIKKRWIERLVGEIYHEGRSTHIFTSYVDDSEGRKYYFKDFISHALLRAIVNKAVRQALKRLKAAGICPGDPEFGLVSADLVGVVADRIVRGIPKDDKSRNEWLMDNGYDRADEFRSGEAMKANK